MIGTYHSVLIEKLAQVGVHYVKDAHAALMEDDQATPATREGLVSALTRASAATKGHTIGLRDIEDAIEVVMAHPAISTFEHNDDFLIYEGI